MGRGVLNKADEEETPKDKGKQPNRRARKKAKQVPYTPCSCTPVNVHPQEGVRPENYVASEGAIAKTKVHLTDFLVVFLIVAEPQMVNISERFITSIFFSCSINMCYFFVQSKRFERFLLKKEKSLTESFL